MSLAQKFYNYLAEEPRLVFGAAALDPQGRIIVACGGCMLLGSAIGPGISGILLDLGGYNAVGGFILVSMLIAVALALKINHDL